MIRSLVLATLAVAFIASAARAQAPGAAAAAFERYLRLTDARVNDETASASRFLWTDTLSGSARNGAAAALRHGEVVTSRLSADKDAPVEVPGGIINHWVGIIFIPRATVSETVALLQDYDRHGEIYKPAITQAHLVSHEGSDFVFTMRFVIRKVITAVLQTDQRAHFERPSPDRAYSRIVSTRIAEIDNAGTPTEREKAPGEDRGYLWRLVSYWRFQERDGGTYVQCESVSLSRPLPTGLGWLFGRAAAGVPRDITIANLQATRRALAK